MNINEKQDAVIKEFDNLNDWMDKYEYLIESGRELEPYDEKLKTEEHLIQGCQSRVWLNVENIDGRIIFTADSDAIITRGMISLLIRVLSGQKPEDIANADLYFPEKMGLKDNLSPTRANGLLSMIKQMKLYAARTTND